MSHIKVTCWCIRHLSTRERKWTPFFIEALRSILLSIVVLFQCCLRAGYASPVGVISARGMDVAFNAVMEARFLHVFEDKMRE